MALQDPAAPETVVLPAPHSCASVNICSRLSLMALFSIGFMLIAIGFVRLPLYRGRDDSHKRTREVNRTTWGSVETLAAAVVANVPTLFSLRHEQLSTYSSNLSHGHNYANTTGFRQVKDSNVAIPGSIGLQRMSIEDVGG